MKFNIEITIRTQAFPIGRSELVESTTIGVEAPTYNEALERTFTALKTCNTFSEFMDKSCVGPVTTKE